MSSAISESMPCVCEGTLDLRAAMGRAAVLLGKDDTALPAKLLEQARPWVGGLDVCRAPA